MATIKRFEDLEVWKKARALSIEIYELTFTKPLSQDFRLRDQMRGSVGSIMDNIAEGFEKLYSHVDEVAKMIAGFIEYLNTSHIKGKKFKNRTSSEN